MHVVGGVGCGKRHEKSEEEELGKHQIDLAYLLSFSPQHNSFTFYSSKPTHGTARSVQSSIWPNFTELIYE
jgi:hypothetical protein